MRYCTRWGSASQSQPTNRDRSGEGKGRRKTGTGRISLQLIARGWGSTAPAYLGATRSGSAEREMRMMGLCAPARGETAWLVIAWLRNLVRYHNGQRTFEQCSPSPSATAPPSPCDPSQVANSPTILIGWVGE